jgi:hypothetical protein
LFALFLRAGGGTACACALAAAFFCAAPLAAAGKSDPALTEADGLIQDKRYGEAILILKKFAEKDNERFDAAETRIHAIFQQKNAYYALINELVDTLEDAPDQFEKIVAVTGVLKKMDIPQTDSERYFIDNIDYIALLALKRRQIDDILKEGRALLDKDDFTAAALKYESGFAIFEKEMKEASLGEAIVKGAAENRTKAALAADVVAEAAAPAASFHSALNAASPVTEAPGRLRAAAHALEDLLPELDGLIRAKANLVDAAAFFSGVRSGAEAAVKKSEQIGLFFFPTSALLIRGRPGEGGSEGILGAADALWKSIVRPFDDAYAGEAERLWKEAHAEAEREAGSRPTVKAARDFIAGPLVLAAKSALFSEAGRKPEDPAPHLIDANILRFRAMDDTLAAFDDIIGTRAYSGLQRNTRSAAVLASWKEGKIGDQSAFTEIQKDRATIQSLARTLEKDIETIDSGIAECQTRSAGAAGPDDAEPIARALNHLAAAKRLLESAGEEVFAGALDSALDLYAIANAGLEARLRSLEKDYTQTVPLMEGMEIKTEQGQEVLAHYPREANRVYNSMEDALTDSAQFAEVVYDELQKEPSRLGEYGTFRSVGDQTISLVAKVRALNDDAGNARTLSRDRYQRAESLWRSGERALEEARTALQRGGAGGARAQLDAAVSGLSESLELQENSAIRTLWTNRLEPLAAEIARLEYEEAVKEIREYINNARTRYFNGEAERAEEILVRAETRWAAVRPEPNEEITHWLTIVRGAIALREGTVIPITAPLYPQMSQLLNNAQKEYNDGAALLAARKRAEARSKMEGAQEKTREVRLLYPLNQEARLLELKIEQLLDPAQFESSFRARYNEAASGALKGSMEAYIELENLFQLRPNHPGMRATVAEAQYALGLKMRPVVKSASERAAELASSARRILVAGDPARYAEALSLARRALILDPGNSVAAQTADRLQISQSADAVLVADTAGEQDYFRAVREFQQGNGILAMSIVERLLQNPANRNNVRINALRRRIQSSL